MTLRSLFVPIILFLSPLLFTIKILLWVKHQNDAVLIWRAKLATSAALFGRLMEGHLATIKAASLCPTPLDCSSATPLCQAPLRFVLLTFLLIVLYNQLMAVDDAFTELDLSCSTLIYILQCLGMVSKVKEICEEKKERERSFDVGFLLRWVSLFAVLSYSSLFLL